MKEEEEDDDENEVVMEKSQRKGRKGEREAGEERDRKRGMGNPKTNRIKKFLSLTRYIRRFVKKILITVFIVKGTVTFW